MTKPGKDQEVREVCAQLQARLADLRAVVADMNAILLPPEADPGKERVVTS